MTPPKVSDDTRQRLLETAWALMAGEGRLDIGMAELAATAGVTRQTLFHAFGHRAGLLVAMARHRDTTSEPVSRMRTLGRGSGADAATLAAFVTAWCDYLPDIYPVAVQLEAASLTDPAAAAAWQDRMFSQGLRQGLDVILDRMARAGALPAGQDPARVADLLVSLLAPSTWRHLVAERGWTPAEFLQSRLRLLEAALAAAPIRAKVARKKPAR